MAPRHHAGRGHAWLLLLLGLPYLPLLHLRPAAPRGSGVRLKARGGKAPVSIHSGSLDLSMRREEHEEEQRQQNGKRKEQQEATWELQKLPDGTWLEGVVTEVLELGAIVKVATKRGLHAVGLLHAEHVVEGPAQVGSRMQVMVHSADHRSGQVVFTTKLQSRVLRSFQKLENTEWIEGTVKHIEDHGAWVHIEMRKSWHSETVLAFLPNYAVRTSITRHVSEVLALGDAVRVRVVHCGEGVVELSMIEEGHVRQAMEKADPMRWVKGTVEVITQHYALVSLDGPDGNRQLGTLQQNHARNYKLQGLKVGESLLVRIVQVDKAHEGLAHGRLFLSTVDPEDVQDLERYKGWLTGKVHYVTAMGFFVLVQHFRKKVAVYGFVHKSKMAHFFVGDVADMVKKGQKVKVKVEEGNVKKALLPCCTMLDERNPLAHAKPPFMARASSERTVDAMNVELAEDAPPFHMEPDSEKLEVGGAYRVRVTREGTLPAGKRRKRVAFVRLCE